MNNMHGHACAQRPKRGRMLEQSCTQHTLAHRSSDVWPGTADEQHAGDVVSFLGGLPLPRDEMEGGVAVLRDRDHTRKAVEGLREILEFQIGKVLIIRFPDSGLHTMDCTRAIRSVG